MQVLWAVAPLPVTSQLLLRAAPRWGRHGSVALGVACNAALQGMIVAVSVRLERGDHYFWRSSWRRVTTAWHMLAMHVVLICGIFAMQRLIARRQAGAVAPCESADGARAVFREAEQRHDGGGTTGASGGAVLGETAQSGGRSDACRPDEGCPSGTDLPKAPGFGR